MRLRRDAGRTRAENASRTAPPASGRTARATRKTQKSPAAHGPPATRGRSRTTVPPARPRRTAQAVSISLTRTKTPLERDQETPSSRCTRPRDATSPPRNGTTCTRKCEAPERPNARAGAIRSSFGSRRFRRAPRNTWEAKNTAKPARSGAGRACPRLARAPGGARRIARTRSARSAAVKRAPKIFLERGKGGARSTSRAGSSGGIRLFSLQRNFLFFSSSRFFPSLFQHELLEERPVDGDEVREEPGENADDGRDEKHGREEKRLEVAGRVVAREDQVDVAPYESEAGSGEERRAPEEDRQRLVERRDAQDVRALHEHVVRRTPDQARLSHGRVRAHRDRGDGDFLVAGLDERLERVRHPREDVEPERGFAREGAEARGRVRHLGSRGAPHDPRAEALGKALAGREIRLRRNPAVANDDLGLAPQEGRHEGLDVGRRVLAVRVRRDDHVGSEA